MNKKLFIDIETTGLDSTAKIREIGLIYTNNNKLIKSVELKGKDLYHSLVLTLEQFVDKFNKEDKLWFIGYNAKFDSDFIRRLFEENSDKFYGSYFHNPYVDVMNLAAYKFMIRNKKIENFKLSTVCKYFKIPIKEEKLHSALYDAEITKKLYYKLNKF